MTRARLRRTLLGGSMALVVLGCPEEPDLNRVEEYESKEFMLDTATPMAAFEIDACSSAGRLWVEVGADLQLPEDAVVGITLEHAGRVVTGFADGTDDLDRVSATMTRVNCDAPISVTFERLDGALEGLVTAVMVLAADADGLEGQSDLEVR